MREKRFPKGWDENRVASLLAYYEGQSEEEAVAEDEATLADHSQTLIEIPSDLLPAVRDLLAKRSGVA